MIAVIRIRGTVNIEPRTKLGLESLRLLRPNHMALLPTGNQSMRMCQKVKDYVAFGEVDGKALALLFGKRLETRDGQRVAEGYLKAKKINGFGELAEQVASGKVKLGELGISSVFRLHPPKKGHRRKGIKAPYSMGGALGYRGKEISELIMRMA